MAALGPLQVRPEAHARLVREHAAVWSFAVGSSVAAALGLAWWDGRGDLARPALIVALAGIVALVADVFRKQSAWVRFRVGLTDEALSAWEEGPGTGGRGRERSVRKGDVSAIVYATWPARGVVVKPVAGRGLFVPEGVERFNDLCLLLAKWKQIDESRTPRWIARSWPLVAIGAPLLEAASILAPVGPVRALVSVVLAAFGVVAMVNAMRSRRLTWRGRALTLLLVVPVSWLLWNAASWNGVWPSPR